ncbi:uncharacterized protein LOC132904307 [Amyelois transitella]|uniref:uncharacterized protein LOC132904307 n=1 Tax=Amyelois transitella TaxID=680683 RepID=UPI0029906ABD|nr:uncharacterized protein LOC132904307 [Amyelois transitella]
MNLLALRAVLQVAPVLQIAIKISHPMIVSKILHSEEEQQPQAQLPGIQDFPQSSAVDNQELFKIKSPLPRVDDQPPSVDEHPSSVDEQSPSVDVESRRKCGKRKAEPLLWKRNQSKLLKNKGMSYTSMSKSKKVYNAKKLGPVCSDKCKLKCSTEFTFEEREHIFEKFWDSGDLEIQRQFIHNHMTKIEPKYRYVREGTSRKNCNHAFYLTRNNIKTRVCKVFFMNTLAISDTVIRTVVKKQSETGVQLKDKRGKHDNHKKLDAELTDGVKAHINSIPRIESHYCRARSTREYIEGGLTVAALYRHYLEKCESESAQYVSYQAYYNIFTHDFNISFWQPKKDQCEDCMAYQNAEDKSLLQETYDEHLKQKTLARNEKDRDKELVSNTFVVAVYDLQAVMPCPRGDVSSFYYTSKLNLLNFTITELGTKDTTCFVWHEGEGARDQYITLIKTAKKTGKPYTVEELTHENFFDLKSLFIGNYNIDDNGNKFKWADIKILKTDKVSNGIFFFKTSYEDEEFKSEIGGREDQSILEICHGEPIMIA